MLVYIYIVFNMSARNSVHLFVKVIFDRTGTKPYMS